MLEKCFLAENYKFYLPKNNLFSNTTFIKIILTELSAGIVLKLTFKALFFYFMFKDKLYFIVIIFIRTFSKNS
jgi:hypothetical protein